MFSAVKPIQPLNSAGVFTDGVYEITMAVLCKQHCADVSQDIEAGLVWNRAIYKESRHHYLTC